jgi:nicotinamide mononucleotide transporter
MMDPAEAAGFALAVVMVWCSIRELHWSWPLAIASSALYFFVFRDSQLYGEASLQVVFAVLALWGWWQWLRPVAFSPSHEAPSPEVPPAAASPAPTSALPIRTLSRRARWQCVLSSLLLWPLLALFLMHYTDTDVPWWDGLVTALSLVGQYLLGRKYLENWLVWLLVNTLSMGLFAYKDLWLTVVLYAIFTAMSVIGWRTWHKQIQ